MLGSHLIKSWSSTQASVALSSGEAACYGLVRGVGLGLGIQSLYRDVGLEFGLRAWTDSSAAIGVAKRQCDERMGTRQERMGTGRERGAIELLRQHADYQSWYDRTDLSLKKTIQDVQYVAAMNHKCGWSARWGFKRLTDLAYA